MPTKNLSTALVIQTPCVASCLSSDTSKHCSSWWFLPLRVCRFDFAALILASFFFIYMFQFRIWSQTCIMYNTIAFSWIYLMMVQDFSFVWTLSFISNLNLTSNRIEFLYNNTRFQPIKYPILLNCWITQVSSVYETFLSLNYLCNVMLPDIR